MCVASYVVCSTSILNLVNFGPQIRD